MVWNPKEEMHNILQSKVVFFYYLMCHMLINEGPCKYAKRTIIFVISLLLSHLQLDIRQGIVEQSLFMSFLLFNSNNNKKK